MEPDATLARVMDIVRGLALESGGPRARDAVTPNASLEREVGLGSLERVELLLRLENATGHEFDETHLRLDTATELARALGDRQLASEPRPVANAPLSAPAGHLRPPPDVRTLGAALAFRARFEPSRTHVFLRGSHGIEASLSFGDLWNAASAIAGGLADTGVSHGDRVALVLPTGKDFLAAFMGVELLGAVPVPLYPPLRLDRLGEYARRQGTILRDSGASVLVTTDEALPLAGLLGSRTPCLGTVTTAASLRRATPQAPAEVLPSDSALVQYTSGSTSDPKGVVLTHANLVANMEAIATGIELRPSDVGVSWLPLYHDMGLIGSWLFCLWHGIPLALLPPQVFLARPEAWLIAIHEHRATLSAAPNFAYELCSRRVKDAVITALDLSCWRAALNGAEPVSPLTLDRFARRLAPAGFRAEAMTPVYGLAESSVALTFPPVGRGPRLHRVDREAFSSAGAAKDAHPGDSRALVFVSAGSPLPRHEIRVDSDGGGPAAEGVVGRILFRGPSSTSGYLGQPAAALVQEDGWIDSGDLGYIAAGELYVTGRRKDLIIIAGRNLVPQEVEEATSSVEGVRKGAVAAFGLPREETGSEALVVVAETRLDAAEHPRLASEITACVTDLVGLPPERIILVEPGTVPRTSSGKVRRQATRDLLVSGALEVNAGLGPADAVELAARATAAWLRGHAIGVGSRLVYGAWFALVTSSLGLAAWVLLLLFPSRRFAMALGRQISRFGLRALGCRVECRGLENIPGSGPAVLVANHASYVDAVVLASVIPRAFLFLAKREALDLPVVGTYLERAGHLTVDRGDALDSVSAAAAAVVALSKGEAVLFFPEGTFTPNEGLRPFRAGAFKVALDTRAPIIPVALRGTRLVLRGEECCPHPGLVQVTVGEALEASGEGWAALAALRNRSSDFIAAHCGESRLDTISAKPAVPHASGES